MSKPQAILLCGRPDQIPYVYTPSQLDEIAALTELDRRIISREELLSGAGNAAEFVFSTWGIPHLTEEEIAAHLPKARVLFYAAGATDAFARPFFARGVAVSSAWLANAIPVAETCLAQILLALKGYFRCTRMSRDLAGRRASRACIGPGIYDVTVALIGNGAISQHLQELLKSHRVKVLVVNSRPEKRTVSLEEAFSTAQVVSNHLPDRDDNKQLLCGRHFAAMREGAVFINTGRGAQVNEPEMCEVLARRPDLTALLDVTYPEPPEADSPLYTLPNVQLSCHLAGSINNEVHRMAQYMIDELKRVLAGEPLLYRVSDGILQSSGPAR